MSKLKDFFDKLGDSTGIHASDVAKGGSGILGIIGSATGTSSITDLISNKWQQGSNGGFELGDILGGQPTNTGVVGPKDTQTNNKVDYSAMIKQYWYVPLAIIIYIFRKPLSKIFR
ncbi:MAG: hypothetical protein FADNKDHG_01468 [Holosporales bacterium]